MTAFDLTTAASQRPLTAFGKIAGRSSHQFSGTADILCLVSMATIQVTRVGSDLAPKANGLSFVERVTAAC